MTAFFFSVLCLLFSVLSTQAAQARGIRQWFEETGYGNPNGALSFLYEREYQPGHDLSRTALDQPFLMPMAKAQKITIDALRDMRPWLDSEGATNFTYSDAVVALAQIQSGQASDARRLLDPYLPQGTAVNFSGFHDQLADASTSIAVGPNAWVLTAAVRLLEAGEGGASYDTLARNVADWLLTRQQANGGLLNAGGAGGAGAHFGTEQNLAAYAALSAYAARSGDARYQQVADRIQNWILTSGVVDAVSGTVYVGTSPAGVVDQRFALDGATMLILSLGPQRLDNLFGAAFLDRLVARMETLRGANGFAAGGAGLPPAYWNEGSGQAAAAYRSLAFYYRGLGQSQTADDFQARAEALRGLLTNQQVSRGAIPVGQGVDFSGFALTNNAQGESPAATAWYLFSRLETNPLN